MGLPSSDATPAERRQMTVVFCDMVGSSALSTRLDPEEHRDVVSAFQACCGAEIGRFDGMVAQYLGDGVLAYFGYPSAHEDDAERAIRASLALIDAAGALRPNQNVTLQARIGIATGLVVVGDLVRGGVMQANAAIGETTNLAARLQSLAEPNTLVVCAQTQQLAGGMFEYRELGAHTLKGFGAPVRVAQVLRPSAFENRFEARYQGGVSRLLGREEDLELLMRRWAQAKKGQGRVVLLSGEAGIGKSRLTQAVQERLSAEPHTRMIYHCSAYHHDNALHPIISHLSRGARFEPDDDAATKRAKLEQLLERSEQSSDEERALFAALLSIPTSGPNRLAGLTPQQLKERTFGALLAHLHRLCARQPVLMLFEDLHWVDATTLELLSRLVEQAPRMALLLLVTARQEFTPSWPNERHISTIMLTRLSGDEIRVLVTDVTRGKELPVELLEQIVQRTDGVPLFVEELTKTVLESGMLREAGDRLELSGPLSPLVIPSTLHASLLARLDRLGAAKGVAQIGATIGREFSYELIAAVTGMPGQELGAALEQLAHAELLFERGAPPDATYIFKHALVQDAAYSSLVRSRRQQLHGLIASILERQYPNLVSDESAILAHHYTEAGLIDQAIPFWTMAGRNSVARSANVEAVGHFGNALRLLASQSEGPERDRRELDLRLQHGLPLIATRGYASDDVDGHYKETIALAQRLGDNDAEFAATRSLWNCVYDRADLTLALELSERLVRLSEISASDDKRALAFRALGSTLMNRADLAGAETAFDQCLAASGTLPASTWIQSHGEVPTLVARHYKSWISALRGKLDDAQRALAAVVAEAARLDHPISLAFAGAGLLFVQLARGDHHELKATVRENLALCHDQSLVFWFAFAQICEGVVCARFEDSEEGLTLAERGLKDWIATGAQLHVPTWSTLVADAALHLGQDARAEGLVSDGLQRAKATGEFFALAELERLKGYVLLRAGEKDAGRQMLERARATARAQGTVLFELRAATHLAQSLIADGECARATEILQPILDVLTQHRTGPDYSRAFQLLEQCWSG